MKMSCYAIWAFVVFCFTGAVALAEFIAESMKLVRLDLRENEIKTGGLMALSLALKVSQSVTRIDIDKGPKKESVSDLLVYCFDCRAL